MPADRFKSQKERVQRRTIDGTRPRDFFPLQFRWCPSCKQANVTVRKLETKVVVLCKKCFLEYVFTKYPAFEDIDYYNKMLDTFRQDARDGKLNSATFAPLEKGVIRCPLCNLGTFEIIQWRKRQRFIKCSNSSCQARYSLPFDGVFKRTNETCKRCGWPLLFWEFNGRFALYCFNPDCKYRSGWTWKHYKQKTEQVDKT